MQDVSAPASMSGELEQRPRNPASNVRSVRVRSEFSAEEARPCEDISDCYAPVEHTAKREQRKVQREIGEARDVVANDAVKRDNSSAVSFR